MRREERETDKMIPICLVTGFLGSGKTTLLQRIVDRHKEKRLVYLVNEFADVDIDGQRLSVPEDHLLTLPGGSIFCRCLTVQFVQTLRSIEGIFESDHENPDGVVIETSGVADPNVIQQMLHETKLDTVYSLRRVISVADPGNFLILIHTLPNIIRQIEASDLAILNKIDLRPPEEIESAEEKIREIQPRIRIERTQYCDIELDPFAPGVVGAMSGEYALCADPNFAKTAIRAPGRMDWERIKIALDGILPDVYRVKGFVPAASGTLYVDYSSSGWYEETVSPEADAPMMELVLISKGEAGNHAQVIAASIEAGDFNCGEVSSCPNTSGALRKCCSGESPNASGD